MMFLGSRKVLNPVSGVTSKICCGTVGNRHVCCGRSQCRQLERQQSHLAECLLQRHRGGERLYDSYSTLPSPMPATTAGATSGVRRIPPTAGQSQRDGVSISNMNVGAFGFIPSRGQWNLQQYFG